MTIYFYIIRRKLLSFLVLLFFASTVAYPQSLSEIMSSGKYYWGQGLSDNERNADRQAIRDFTTKLSVELSDNFMKIAEDKSRVKDFTKSVFDTYVNTSFKDLERKEERKPGSILVVRYIEKENIEALFYDRKMQILDYYDMGAKAHAENRLGEALQKYYWSLLLLNTHPENQSIYITENNINISLSQYLPSKINQVLNSLSFSVGDIKFDDNDKSGLLTLKIVNKGDGNPVEDLSFSYFLNDSWNSSVCKNGTGAIRFGDKELLGEGKIPLKVNYRYEEAAQIDREVSDIFETFYRLPNFDAAKLDLEIKPDLFKKEVKEIPVAKATAKVEFSTVNDGVEVAFVEEKIRRIVNAVEGKKYDSVRDDFTEEGWQDFNSLVKYGKARLLSDNLDLKIIKVNDEFVVRKVPMLFRFNSGRKDFVENLVFYIDSLSRKVSGLSFSISQAAIRDILSHSEEWGSERDKWQLITFMENYKTAYCLKRFAYIEKIFDEDALIIVGRNLQKSTTIRAEDEISYYGDNAEFVRKSKTEYIESLRMVFKSNEFINIHFEDNLVKRRNAKEKIFGIQIAQYYTSSRYSDKGYLFLMLDLKDSLNPKIHVRTWQPEKNPDGSIFGLTDFHF